MGAGPRTGTSFVMRKLKEAGVPIYWTPWLPLPKQGNPDGYFDTHQDELSLLSNLVVKVWPRMAFHVEIERMVVLRRDRATQIESLTQQMEREKKLLVGMDWTPESLIDACQVALERIDAPQRCYQTEGLDQTIPEIIEYLRYT